MGRITEDLTYETTFKVRDDIALICGKVEYASNMSSRRYLFVGEYHDFEMDVFRRKEVAKHFANNADIVFVSERGLHASPDKTLADLVTRTGGVHEQDEVSGPFDPIRNTKMVEQILAEIAEDPDHRKRAVLIFFGQDHEAGLRRELELQTAADVSICWWSFPSIREQFFALPAVVFPNQVGYTMLGFTGSPDLNTLLPGKLLLTRGIWRFAFGIEVRAVYSCNTSLLKNTTLYAVFTNDNIAILQAQIQGIERHGGKGNVTASQADAIRLVEITTDAEYQRLKKLGLDAMS